MRKVFEEWTSYLEQIVPKAATDVQVEETRRAFYAGAWAAYVLALEAVADEDEQQCERNIEQLRNEIVDILGDLRLEERLRR